MGEWGDWLGHWQLRFSNEHPLNTWITAQVNNCIKISGVLKMIQGGNFEKDHWTHLFKILQMKDAKLDTLTFADILEKKDVLMDPKVEAQIKELSVRVRLWELYCGIQMYK